MDRTTLVPPYIRSVDPVYIAESIQMCQKIILLDARSFVEYSTSHIIGALNIGGNRSFRRKFSRSEVPIDIFLQKLTKEDMQTLCDIPIVIYDHCVDDFKLLRSDCFLYIVITRVLTKFTSVFLLKGGFLAFQSIYSDLCWKSERQLPGDDFTEYSDFDTEHILDSCCPLPPRHCSASSSCSDLRSAPALCLPSPQQNMTGSAIAQPKRIPPTSSSSGAARPASLSGGLRPSPILPHLILGSQSDAQSITLCQQYGVTHVINVSVDGPRPTHIRPSNFLRIPVHDNYTDSMFPYFDTTFQFIDQVRTVKGRVLIHCSAGISRSPTLAIAYLMHSCRITMRKAYSIVKSSRSAIAPNFNFLGQLLEFERVLLGTNTLSRRDEGPQNNSRSCTSMSGGSANRDAQQSLQSSVSSDPVLSNSPKHVQTKKRDRPTCLGIDPSGVLHSNMISSTVFLKSLPEVSPNEGKRSRTSFDSPRSKCPDSLLPSPSTFFARLDLSSPSENRKPFSPSSTALPTTEPEERLATYPSVTGACSHSMDKLHFEFCPSPGTCLPTHSSFANRVHITNSVTAPMIRPTLLAQRSLCSVYDTPSSSLSPDQIINFRPTSEIPPDLVPSRSLTPPSPQLPVTIRPTRDSIMQQAPRPRPLVTLSLSRLSCSTPTALNVNSRLISPTSLRAYASVGADLMRYSVDTKSCSSIPALFGKQELRSFRSWIESSCRQQQQQQNQIICKSSSSSSNSGSITSASTAAHNSNCYNVYSVS